MEFLGALGKLWSSQQPSCLPSCLSVIETPPELICAG